jgi:putative transposase
MKSQDVDYRRNLPHIHPEGFPIFITFNLVESLPKEVTKRLKEQRDQEMKALAADANTKAQVHEKYFDKYDEWLDKCEHGHQWLKDERIASIVMRKIHSFENERYELLTHCIMPNHVHLLVRLMDGHALNHKGKTAIYPLTDTVRLIKGSTARECNLVLKRTGSFWQHESYDHYVRDEHELERIINYILNNPVKAGLVKEWTEWKFTYINPNLGSL